MSVIETLDAAASDEAGLPDYKVIEDLATLRLLSDPLRLRLIEELGVRPTTVKELAKTLAMKPNRLYYHVNLLEEHGLVKVTDTRLVSGILERTYGLVAKHFAVSDDLTMPAELKRDVADTLFRLVSAELGEALEREAKGGPAGVVGRIQLWLTEQERSGFEKQLSELLAAYASGEKHRADADADRYTLLYALYAPVGNSRPK